MQPNDVTARVICAQKMLFVCVSITTGKQF